MEEDLKMNYEKNVTAPSENWSDLKVAMQQYNGYSWLIQFDRSIWKRFRLICSLLALNKSYFWVNNLRRSVPAFHMLQSAWAEWEWTGDTINVGNINFWRVFLRSGRTLAIYVATHRLIRVALVDFDLYATVINAYNYVKSTAHHKSIFYESIINMRKMWEQSWLICTYFAKRKKKWNARGRNSTNMFCRIRKSLFCHGIGNAENIHASAVNTTPSITYSVMNLNVNKQQQQCAA